MVKDALSDTARREKRAPPLLSKTERVQWLVSEVPEVTCATIRAEQPSARWHHARGEGGRGLGQLSRTEWKPAGRVQTAALGLRLKMFQVTRFELCESASTDETFAGTFQASCSNRIFAESLIIIIAQPCSSAVDPTKTAIGP